MRHQNIAKGSKEKHQKKYQNETWIQKVGKKRVLEETQKQLSEKKVEQDEKAVNEPKCYLSELNDIDAAVEEIWNPKLTVEPPREEHQNESAYIKLMERIKD